MCPPECRLCFSNSIDFINLFDGSEYSSYVIGVVNEHIGEVKKGYFKNRIKIIRFPVLTNNLY